MGSVKANVAIYLDKSHPKKSNECAIYLRITHKRTRKYYPTNKSLTELQFQKAISNKPGKLLQGISDDLQRLKIKAVDIIDKMQGFSFDTFQKKFDNNYSANDTIATIFETHIKKLKESDRIGTAISYLNAKVSLDAFKPGCMFSDVTISFLESYEKSMLEKGRSKTTIGMYLRNLRTVFNEAIHEAGVVSADRYPFGKGKGKYKIPKGGNVKKALPLDEIELIYNYKTKVGSVRHEAKLLWLFSFWASGINIADLARLKYSNIHGDSIHFVRKKTENTTNETITIVVSITANMKEIIDEIGNKSKSADSYIFKILKSGLDATRERALVLQQIGVINANIKLIAKAVGITQNVTTYVARHSYATNSEKKGVPIQNISENLGHSSLQITMDYIKGADPEKKMQNANLLSINKK